MAAHYFIGHRWWPQVLSWSLQPHPDPEIAGGRRRPGPSLRRYRRACSLAALLPPATPPPPGVRPMSVRLAGQSARETCQTPARPPYFKPANLPPA